MSTTMADGSYKNGPKSWQGDAVEDLSCVGPARQFHLSSNVAEKHAWRQPSSPYVATKDCCHHELH
jgi:hypothetical protein